MKGMLGLWKNESIKIFRPVANKIILIIAVLLIAVPPCFTYIISRSEKGGYDEYYYVPDDDADAEVKVYFYAERDTRDFFRDNEISQNSWRYSRYCGSYRDLKMKQYACEEVTSGRTDAQTVASLFGWLFETPSETDVYTEDGMLHDGPAAVSPSYEEITADDIDFAQELEKTKADLAELEYNITEQSVKEYALSRADSAKKTLEAAKLQRAEASANYGDGKNSAYLGAFNRAKADVEIAEYQISAYKAFAEADKDEEDWMFSEIEGCLPMVFSTLRESCVEDEKTFISEDYGDRTYEQYKRECEKTQSRAREAAITVQYSLDNKIPLSDYVQNSTKSTVYGSLGTAAAITVIVMIIITVTLIAGEYSNGTIRLLLIRPKTRSKIIISKFLALMTCAILISIVGFVLVYGISIALFGVSDAFVPELMYSSGVIEVPALVYGALKLILPLFSGMFIISIAFMMATVTEKIAVAAVLPFIVDMFSGVVQTIALSLIEKFSFLRFTVLPYLNLGNLLVSPVDRFIYRPMIFSPDAAVYSDISLLAGVIIIALHTLAMYIIALAVFRKKEIKS